jgi:hypothetical protein
MLDSFVRYQTKLIRALDVMAKKYNFVTVDATRPPDVIFRDLQQGISNLDIKKIRNVPRLNGSNGAKRPRKHS